MRRTAASTRAPALPPLCLLGCLFLGGCTVRTGFCETDDDCPAGMACDPMSRRCWDQPAAADLGEDLSVEVPDGPEEPDLTKPPPDLAGIDLLGTALLEVERTGDGGGVIRSEPAGIECGGRCAAVFPRGTRVRLQVEPDQDSFFTGWSGGGCSGEGGCDVSLSSDVRVQASLRRRSFAPVSSGTSVTLRAAFGVTAPAVRAWAVGEQGTVLEWNGTSWRSLSNPRGHDLFGVWADRPDNVWVVGERPMMNDGTVQRWNGSSWTDGNFVAIPRPLRAISGAGPSALWAVGRDGTAIFYDGSPVWRSDSAGVTKELRGTWSIAANNVWVVGLGGAVSRWDGTDWRVQSSPTPSNLYGVWAAGPSALWAVGADGTIVRWNGMSWTKETSPVPAVSLRAVFGFTDGMGQATEVWAVGERGTVLRRRGTSWTVVPSNTMVALYGVWGERPGELWTVGEQGKIYRYAAHR